LEERLPLLVLSGPEVHRLLGYADCVAALRSGLGALPDPGNLTLAAAW
jgi:hypothetical protein